MSRKRSKALAVLSTAIVIAGIMVAVRVHRSDVAEKSKTAASAPSKLSTPATPASSSTAGLTLDDWSHKIADTDIKDFHNLMELAMGIEDAELRNTVVVGIVDRWMLEDAQSFIKYLATLEVNGADRSLAIVINALQESLTKLDPERAASDEILVIVQRLIDYLAETDPDKALVWAKKWLLDDTLETALVAVARGMARTDIEKSLAIIAEIKSSLRRSQAMAAVGGIWATKDPVAALKWAIGLQYSGERALTLNSVLLAIAQSDPSSAAADLTAQAQQISDQYKQARAAELAAAGKTEVDFANDPESYKAGVENGTIAPPNSPDLELMADAGKVIAAKIAAGDPAGAVAFAEGLQGDYLKLKSLAGALDGWAKVDPASAYAYASQNYPENSELVSSIYSSWAAADWLAAANGTSMISDPAKRALALEAVIKSGSAKGNSADLASYVQNLPAAQSSDGVKLAMATAISQQSPQTAWEIAKSITSETAQYRALKNAFANLVIQNPAEATALLGSTALSNNTSERLKEMLDAVTGN